MFEEMTYETILGRMTDRVKQSYPAIDTREGSLLHAALAPAAIELAGAYIAMDSMLNEAFADTASRDFLIRRCAERGITPRPAVAAVRHADFDVYVEPGARFTIGGLAFYVKDKVATYTWLVQCEEAGASGNLQGGALVPVDYIEGLQTALLTDIVIPGSDAEDTESLRKRYFASFDGQAFGGNVADYKEKTMSLPGVGGVKVHPVWDGGGTVKVVIVDGLGNAPSTELIGSVQDALDPTRGAVQGIGIAPIGHVVTVVGATPVTIAIAADVTLADGYGSDAVTDGIAAAIGGYFSELIESWSDVDRLTVRISQIENRILGVTGVLDVTATSLNGSEQNLELDVDAIPVLGTVTAT